MRRISRQGINMKWMVLRALRQRAGIELARARKNPNIMDYIHNRKVNLVLDVGANTGQFGRWLRHRGYAGQIISFEPVKKAFKELEEATRGDDLWTASHLALGSSSGVMAINASKNSQFSSFNDLTATARRYDPDAEFTGSESVIVKTLDEASPSRDAGLNILLKIDTQGFERPVLEGAKKTLKDVIGVLIELPIMKLYKDNWSFHEAVAYMEKLGFVLAQAHPVNIHSRVIDSATEFDCLFRPVDPSID
jgi:FkbM family methyltransferase